MTARDWVWDQEIRLGLVLAWVADRLYEAAEILGRVGDRLEERGWSRLGRIPR